MPTLYENILNAVVELPCSQGIQGQPLTVVQSHGIVGRGGVGVQLLVGALDHGLLDQGRGNLVHQVHQRKIVAVLEQVPAPKRRLCISCAPEHH